MIHIDWWKKWQLLIREAKERPEHQAALCRDAALAQAQYVITETLYWSFKDTPKF